MADDIVNELRHAAQTDNNPWDDTLYTRAADEIERLRAAGDALAQGVLDELQPFPNDEHIGLWWLTVNWKEARRG